jgi:hypothetical protein
MAKATTKKSTTTTIANVVEYNTIHIFGYGESQLIGKGLNDKVETSKLTLADAVVSNVFSKKPTDNTSTIDFHSINIFNNLFADFTSKEKGSKSFRVKYEELDTDLLTSFVNEVIALKPTTEVVS